MTKEIIVDGVNVAGCEQRFGDDKCALLDQYFCENNSDCYYKQLKRLEQENKEFKEYKTSKENSYQLLQKQWKDLFVQNRELKEENEALIKENEDMKKSFVSHSEFMNILENNPNINWEATAKDNIYLINKYHKALEEIRELNLFSLNNSREKIAKINEIVSEVLR